ncbi:MAG: MFS transporter [Gemmatimonadaceae bacterium]|nr:MFS transporter [Gemmatimonadaceae bacterium]
MTWTRGLGRNVLALSLVSLLTDASSEMIYPLLPTFLATVIGAGAISIGVIEGCAQMTAALLNVASGRWSDRLTSRRPMVLAGYALASVLRPLTGVAQSAAQVLAIRVGDRVGKGIRSSPRDALIADSVEPAMRGRAFGFHRAADHAGAVIGPLIAFVLLQGFSLTIRQVFLLSAIPAALAVLVIMVGVRETGRPLVAARPPMAAPMSGRFRAYLVVLALFTMGNSTDAFLLLRAQEGGVAPQHLPLLWAFLHVVKSLTSTPGGALSDRIGRGPLIVGGWAVYALVYLGFARATSVTQVWLLMAAYGVYYGLTEGVEKALVADLVAPEVRGIAFGWFHLAIGIAALPASLVFGWMWETWGSATAFSAGAACAGGAAVLLALVPRGVAPPRGRG